MSEIPDLTGVRGYWHCPVCGVREIDDDAYAVTTCRNGHMVLLTPVVKGYRISHLDERYQE